MICSVYYKLSAFLLNGTIRGDISGGDKMEKYRKEIDEQEIVAIDRLFIGFLVGIVAILSIWFLSGIFFVILK